MDGQLLQLMIGAVVLDVVDANEPGVLGILHHEFTLLPLVEGMAQRHVIGHRTQPAALRHADVAYFAGLDVGAEEQLAVLFAMGVFEHLALAAATRALVQNGDGVVVRGDHLHGCAMRGQPTFLLADVQQDAIDTLLRAGTRIQVQRVQLVDLVGAVVHDDLLPLTQGVAEGRRQQDDRLRGERLG